MKTKEIFQKYLLEFHQTYPIDKPWINDRDPYKIWLLEVLSQQTRMGQAMPYYEKIVHRFPTISALAKASEDELFSLWKGLGYYSRARNLHFTAKYIVTNLNGIFPNTYSEIIKLKGVGEYTAAAIASFAFCEDVAVLDGNVHRVLSRIFNINKTIQSSKDKAFFQNLSNQLLIKGRSDIYNQSMMNLGSAICTPQNPKCNDCFFTEICEAFQKNIVSNLPPPKVRPILKDRFFYCIFPIVKKKIYLQKRSHNDIWKGLYEGILQEGSEIDPKFWKEKQINISEIVWSEWETQILSHQRIKMKFGIVNLKKSNLEKENFHDINKIDTIALPRIISRWWENQNR